MSFNAQNGGGTFPEVGRNTESGKRNAYFRGLLAGLLLAVSSSVVGKEPVTLVASADTASNTTNVSVDNGGGGRVETAYGNLSFAEIAKHAKREEILNSLGRSDKIDFREWELRKIQTESRSLDHQIEATEKVLARIAGTPGE